jgi:hypothetical protein
LLDAASSVYTLRITGNTAALRWYDRLRVRRREQAE